MSSKQRKWYQKWLTHQIPAMEFWCSHLACLQQTVMKVAFDLLQAYREIPKVTTALSFGNSSPWGSLLLGNKKCCIKLVHCTLSEI